MTAERWKEVKAIFDQVVQSDPGARPKILHDCCANDEELRHEVESLLACDQPTGSLGDGFPIEGPSLFQPAVALSLQEDSFGPYVPVRVLGEGGMGTVYLARQEQPIRREVALKVVKSGLDGRHVIERFNLERQALAIMDHPNVARVLDAGTSGRGQPYFVMEYVAGVPITSYCDNHRLNTRERLELFMRVCEGVQHAHQKAIIHRDLKPSNILVTEEEDGRGSPKIIDFGVAKALTHSLTADTMVTITGVPVGTPAYMSPEQADSSGKDIDTRSDVYSLGIILYELLAGVPPLDLRTITFEEFLRRLREEDPPKPSTRIRTQDRDTSTAVARTRQTEPRALAKLMRGDLDSIALKALEKERSRRYGSASEFAADIGRYLNNEPVLAVPPSAVYRIRKFGRRHRPALVTSAAFLLVLLLAAGISIDQGIRANREAAVSQAVRDFLQRDLLAQAGASAQSAGKLDPELKVRTALDRAAARIAGNFDRQPEVEAAIRDTIGETYADLGLYREARTQLERSLELHRRVLGTTNPKTLKTLSFLAHATFLLGKYADAEALFRQSVDAQRRVLGSEHPDTLYSMSGLTIVYYLLGKYQEASALGSQALEIQRRVLGPESRNTLDSMNTLAMVYYSQGKYAQAEALDTQTLEIRKRLLGPEHPATLGSMTNLAIAYRSQGKYPEAEALDSQTLAIRKRISGPEHPDTLSCMINLANSYMLEGQYAPAEALFNNALENCRRVVGPEHPYTLSLLSDFASMYQREGKYDLAETYAERALKGRRNTLGSQHPDTMRSAADLALAHLARNKFTESEPLAREALEFNRKKQPDDWQRFRAESLLGASLAGQKKYAEAEPLLLEGYRGMAERRELIRVPDRYHLDRAREWIIQLYQAWGKAEEAAAWRQK